MLTMASFNRNQQWGQIFIVAPVKRRIIMGAMKLGSLIKAYMDQQQLSVREMAREIGCSHTTLFRLMKGYPVRPEQVHRVYTWLLQPTAKT